MKTDRELLELAAKAAGYDFSHKWNDKPNKDVVGFVVYENGELLCTCWNPLTDDGDALRLAVKLTLEIDVCRTGIAVRTPNGIKVLVEAEDNPDAYSATRRAIVRAAAAIGETL